VLQHVFGEVTTTGESEQKAEQRPRVGGVGAIEAARITAPQQRNHVRIAWRRHCPTVTHERGRA
jgi:hypothetical protein